MIYAEEIANMQRQANEMRMAEERRKANEKIEAARRSAVSSACTSMAQCSMQTALLHPSHGVAAEAFGESMRWQYNAVLASAGMPLIEKTP